MGLILALSIFALSMFAFIIVLVIKRKELGTLFKILTPLCAVIFIITVIYTAMQMGKNEDKEDKKVTITRRTEETREMDMIMWYDIDISPLTNDRPQRGWWYLNPQHPIAAKESGCYRATTPLLGLYDQRKPETARQHLYWIAALGCNAIAADWTNYTSYRMAKDAGWYKYTKGVYDNTEVLLKEASNTKDFQAPAVYTVVRLFGEDYDKLKEVVDDVYTLYTKYQDAWYKFEDSTKPFLVIFADHTVLSKGADFADDRFNIRWSNGYLGSIGTEEGNNVSIPYGNWLFVENELDESMGDKGLYKAYYAKGADGKPEQMISWASIHKTGMDWDPLNNVIDGKTTYERTIWKVKDIKPKVLIVSRFNYAVCWIDEPQEGVSLYESTHIEPNEDFGFLIFDNVRKNLYELNNWGKNIVEVEEVDAVNDVIKVPLGDFPTEYRVSVNKDMGDSKWNYLNINKWIDVSEFDEDTLYLQLRSGFGESEVIEVRRNR